MTSQEGDADPAGDLTLLIGSGRKQRQIRASSKVLSLASPVFAALLSPKFAEGVSLSQKEWQKAQEIPFPEDDPEAMIWLCHALHFKKCVDEDFSFPLLMKIALLCDKYDLSRALGMWSAMWMRRWPGSINGDDHYMQILWVSYALDNQEAFWEASKQLKYQYDSKGFAVSREVCANGVLPERILGE